MIGKTDIDVLNGDSRTPLIHAWFAGSIELPTWLRFALQTLLITHIRLFDMASNQRKSSRRWLVLIGIVVAVWVNRIAEKTAYFACRLNDIRRLTNVVNSLETTEMLSQNLAAIRSEELFALLENDT